MQRKDSRHSGRELQREYAEAHHNLESLYLLMKWVAGGGGEEMGYQWSNIRCFNDCSTLTLEERDRVDLRYLQWEEKIVWREKKECEEKGLNTGEILQNTEWFNFPFELLYSNTRMWEIRWRNRISEKYVIIINTILEGVYSQDNARWIVS